MRLSIHIGIILFFLFSVGCGEVSRKDLLPRNTGSKGEIAVVAPDQVWTTSYAENIQAGIGTFMYGLPQDELLLKRIEIKASGFGDMFKTHRNILEIKVESGKDPAVLVRHDVYARQQLYIVFRIPDLKALPLLIDQRMADVMQLFHEAEIDRLIDRNRDFGSAELNEEITQITGLDLIMQDKFQIAVKEDDFLWLRLDQSKPLGGYQHTISQGILIYSRPYRDTADFSDSSIYAWKNAINKQYVEGPQNSYMNISDRFILPQFKRITYLDQAAVELRGLWRMEGYFMGGPFYSLVFFNPENGKQYMVEGYAYAPQFDKAPLIREIEAIVRSAQPVD